MKEELLQQKNKKRKKVLVRLVTEERTIRWRTNRRRL